MEKPLFDNYEDLHIAMVKLNTKLEKIRKHYRYIIHGQHVMGKILTQFKT